MAADTDNCRPTCLRESRAAGRASGAAAGQRAAWDPHSGTTEHRPPHGEPDKQPILRADCAPRIVCLCLFSCITAFLRRRYHIRRGLATFTYNPVTKLTDFLLCATSSNGTNRSRRQKNAPVGTFWWRSVLVAVHAHPPMTGARRTSAPAIVSERDHQPAGGTAHPITGVATGKSPTHLCRVIHPAQGGTLRKHDSAKNDLTTS